MKIKQAVKKGFTLVELLVVIAIIAILAAVVAPNAFKAIEKSKVSAAESDFKAVKTAALSYYSDTGKWPGDGAGSGDFVGPDNATSGWNGPYMEKWKSKNPWSGSYTFENDSSVPGAVSGKTYKYIKLDSVPTSAAERLEADLDGSGGTDTTGIVRKDNNGVYLIISEQ